MTDATERSKDNLFKPKRNRWRNRPRNRARILSRASANCNESISVLDKAASVILRCKQNLLS